MNNEKQNSILDGVDATFARDILPLSFEVPLLLDFHASWCAPCRALMPLLEQLVQEYEGAFRLVRIDADANPQLCQCFGVRSLPAVVLLDRGEVQDGFYGVQPLTGVRRFLAGHLQSPAEKQLLRAQALLEQGDAGQAQAVLRRLQQARPDDGAVLAALLGVLLDSGEGGIGLAGELLASASHEALRHPVVQQAASRWRLMQSTLSGVEECQRQYDLSPSVAGRWRLAQALVANEQYEPGLEHLLVLLEEGGCDSEPTSDEVHRLVVEVLNTTPDRGLANRYRRRLFALLHGPVVRQSGS